MTNRLIVAIDGPSGVGKTTTSRLVALELNIPHIDTGSMYRAIGLAARRRGVDTHDAERLEQLAENSHIEFVPGERARVLLDGEDITPLIRTPEISMAASDVSAIPGVRRVLVKLQQDLGRRTGGVLEGRDIGTKVFPASPYKFFLTATPRVRAERRYRELLAKGSSVSFESVLAEATARDEQDSTRAESPLRYDETYTVIDTSSLTTAQVVERIVGRVRGLP
ncbi:MAG: (d)CMP kinase [Thermoanaerobaculia bacterium]